MFAPINILCMSKRVRLITSTPPEKAAFQSSDSQSMGTRTVGKLIIVVEIWTGAISAGETLFVSCDGGGRDEGLRVSHWKRVSQCVAI